MTPKRRVEVFTAGCPVCDEAIKKVRDLACESCEVIVYNLNEPCESGECLEKVKRYRINRIPAVVVDGRLVECCRVGSITMEGLKASGIGAPL